VVRPAGPAPDVVGTGGTVGPARPRWARATLAAARRAPSGRRRTPGGSDQPKPVAGLAGAPRLTPPIGGTAERPGEPNPAAGRTGVHRQTPPARAQPSDQVSRGPLRSERAACPARHPDAPTVQQPGHPKPAAAPHGYPAKLPSTCAQPNGPGQPKPAPRATRKCPAKRPSACTQPNRPGQPKPPRATRKCRARRPPTRPQRAGQLGPEPLHVQCRSGHRMAV
jgi:hypothetical protein